MQVVLIFLAFFSILYWLFQLGGATFIQPFSPFFEVLKEITHIFYTRTVKIDEITIDFSFLIATFVDLFIVWGLKFVIEFFESLEDKYDTAHNYLKQKREDLFNLTLENQQSLSEYKYNNFLIFIRFTAINLAKDSFFHTDVNVGVEEKQVVILKDFSDNIEEVFKCEKKFLKDGILLYFSHFNNVDKIILDIENIIMILKRKYVAEKWQVNCLFGIEAYSSPNEIVSKAEKLVKLTNLGLKNRIVCLGEFKQRYSLLKSPKYQFEGAGVYQLTTGEEEVFYLNNLR